MVLALGWFIPITLPLLTLYGGARLLVMLLRTLWLLGLFIAIALGSLIFPPLAIVGVGIVIWLVVSRISYLIEHAAIIADGLLLYAIGGLQLTLFASGGAFWVGGLFGVSSIGALGRLEGAAGVVLACALVALGTAALLNTRLRSHYGRGYTCAQVHEIATTVPFVLLLLIVAIAGVAFDVAIDVGVEGAPDAPPPDAPPPEVPPPTVDAPPAVPEAPGTVEVAGYVRSNPDGIPQNNLSWEGSRPPGTPEPTGFHEVRGHVRTLGDGIPENNFSYRGAPPDAAVPSGGWAEAPTAARPPGVGAGTAIGAGSAGLAGSASASGRRCPHCGEVPAHFRVLAGGARVCSSCARSHG